MKDLFELEIVACDLEGNTNKLLALLDGLCAVGNLDDSWSGNETEADESHWIMKHDDIHLFAVMIVERLHESLELCDRLNKLTETMIHKSKTGDLKS